MTIPEDDAGTIKTLLDRLVHQRLPRLLELKEKVDDGEPLGGGDLDFLAKAIEDAKSTKPFVDRNPEYQALATQILTLYNDITEKALQLEKDS